MKLKIKNKKKTLIIGVVLVAVVIIIISLVSGGKEKQSEVVAVELGDVVEEVSVTGKVVPTRSIDLAFEKSGRISRIYPVVGEKVDRGAILVRLEGADLWAEVEKAAATLKSAEANLMELKNGARPEEVSVKQAELDKAKQDLNNYFRATKDLLNDAYAKADDAVRTKTDDLFSDDDTSNPKFTFTVLNMQAKIDVESMRYYAGHYLDEWRVELQQLDDNATIDEFTTAILSGKQKLSYIRDYLTRTLDALDVAEGITATTISGYKANVYTARTNVNSSYASISSQEQAISSQKITVQKIESELALIRAGSTAEQMADEEAKVEQMQASLAYYRAQYGKTILTAPFSGVVTKIIEEEGNIISANSPVLSIIGAGNFDIEAYITESDIAKVKVGDTAKVTLDAYGRGVVFDAVVSGIDLSETVLEGVATYKTKIRFTEDDARIISGLTADVDILTNKRLGVLSVPTRNIETEDGKYFVWKAINGDSERVEITVGLKGSDGKTEITGGLSEKDSIIVR